VKVLERICTLSCIALLLAGVALVILNLVAGQSHWTEINGLPLTVVEPSR
jgi:hypothetical protein